MRKLIIAAVVAALALCLAGTAGAATKKLWHLPELDAAVSEVAGTPLKTVTSDNYAEWDYLAGGQGVDGWTCPTCSPSAALYNPFDGYRYNVYRTVWIHPDVWMTLAGVIRDGFSTSLDYNKVGEAMLTLDHEGQHWRLFSPDEARVNACAIADLPRFLQVDWHISTTTQQTMNVPQQYRVKVRKHVRIKGTLVWRYRWVTRTRYVPTVQTVTNPVYQGILNGAASFRAAQPAPYNAGACW